VISTTFWTDGICISFYDVQSIGHVSGQFPKSCQIHLSIQDPLHRFSEDFCDPRLYLQFSRYLSGQGVFSNPLGVNDAGRRNAQPVGVFLRGYPIQTKLLTEYWNLGMERV
jgi:hypothetical protein